MAQSQVGYRELLARYELAFYRVCSPELAERCAEKQEALASSMGPRAVRLLYDFNYKDLERHVYHWVRSDLQSDFKFPGLRYMVKRFDLYQEQFSTELAKHLLDRYPYWKDNYWKRTQVTIAVGFAMGYGDEEAQRVYQMERALALMQGQFENPELFSPRQQVESIRLLSNIHTALGHYAEPAAKALVAAGVPVLAEVSSSWRIRKPNIVDGQCFWPVRIWSNL